MFNIECFKISLSDQYNSKAEINNGLPFCSDPNSASDVYNDERNTLFHSNDVKEMCPVTCTSVLFTGNVDRFKTGKIQVLITS
jgi:hypothetical protein